MQGADPGFQVRTGALTKNHIFSNIRGGALPPPPPPPPHLDPHLRCASNESNTNLEI